MFRARLLFLVVCLLAMAERAYAQEPDGLASVVADETKAPTPTGGSAAAFKVSAYAQEFDLNDEALTAPLVRPNMSSAQLNFDARVTWAPVKSLNLLYEGRAEGLTHYMGDVWDSLRLYTRELALDWEASDQVSVRVGRINQRNGVGYGFNPTDIFRGNTQIDQFSVDPAVRRETRLGSVMATADVFVGRGSASFTFSPKLADPKPIGSPDRGVVDDIYRTNDQQRLVEKIAYDFGADFAPHLLAVETDRYSAIGGDLTRGIGNNVVAYTEWLVGPRKGMVAEAYAMDVASGALPLAGSSHLLDDSARTWRAQLTTGLSLSPSPSLNIVLEYDYNGEAPTAGQWSAIVRAVQSRPTALVIAEYRLLRVYADAEESDLSRSSTFLRTSWGAQGGKGASVSALALVNTDDGSGFAQMTIGYTFNTHLSVTLIGARSFGARGSVYGSGLQQDAISASVGWAF